MLPRLMPNALERFEMMHFKNLVLASVVAMAPSAVFADEVLLTLTHGDAVTEFSFEDLEDLGGVEFSTTTIWTEGVQTFTGVSLKAFLEANEIEDGTLSAQAINDYAVEIPMSDAEEDGPIIAYLRNGEPMSVRDKGPLWIVYPYDQDPKYQTEIIHSRSIWQLDRIQVID